MVTKKLELSDSIWAAFHSTLGPVICDPVKHVQGAKIVFRLWVCNEERFEPADRFQVLNDMLPLESLSNEQTIELERSIKSYMSPKSQIERESLNWLGVEGKLDPMLTTGERLFSRVIGDAPWDIK